MIFHTDLYYPCRGGYIFAVINAECPYSERPRLKTESDLAEGAKLQNGPTTNLQAIVD